MRQINRFEREKQNKKGGSLPVLIFLAFIFLFPLMLSRTVMLIVLPLAAAVFGFVLAFRKARRENAGRNNPVPFRPASPGVGKACPNPEKHRHYETRKPCPNPEPHGHYSGVTQPLTQFEQDAVARKKRLESMRILYNAGILTREEYDYEVRRIKNL